MHLNRLLRIPMKFIYLRHVMGNEADMFGSIVPGAYVAFGISLPLVAAFVVTHLTDLKGTSTIKDPKKDHHLHLLR